jgi:hypothetical protein
MKSVSQRKTASASIYFALHAKANYAETGNPALSAVDQERSRDRAFEKRYNRKVEAKALSTEQMREIVALRDLADKFLG